MANPKTPLQIFKPGRHTALSGAVLAFSESDLAATAAAYDPALKEAPLVVGHPKLDGPAYGWVKSLAFADGGLDAEPQQVDPAFAEMVNAGRFKKISAAFYSPESPSNPVPGVFYLRHVGFLGAAAPGVKGLRDPGFATDEEGIVEFSEWDDVTNAALWRGLRDWFIGKFGQDEADKVIPGYAVQTLEQTAQQEVAESAAEGDTNCCAASPSPSFSQPTQLEASAVTPEEKAALEAENAQLKTQLAAVKSATVHASNLAFAEGQIAAGKLLPADKDMVVATLDHFAALEKAIEFGEGKDKAPLVDAFKTFVGALPKRIEFGETATSAKALGAVDGTVEFAAPDGLSVDGERQALHRKALAYQDEHKTDYVTAVRAVSAQ